MPPVAPLPQEQIRRSASLPGLEVLQALYSPREWRVIPWSFAITVPRDWRGQVTYRGRVLPVEPGTAFCNHPDEALAAKPGPGEPRSFHVLCVDGELLREWLDEQPGPRLEPEWRAITTRISPSFNADLERFFGTLAAGASALELQSRAVELSAGVTRELIARAGEKAVSAGPAIRGTALMRECLSEEGIDIDLDTLAKRAGMSRFQALRAFKRRYGLPPHAYQLCLRVLKARRLLLEGAPPADVAVQCGFVDQSHFNRHFKRIIGVSPMRYVNASAGLPASPYPSGVYRAGTRVALDPEDVLNRSDHERA